MISEIHTRVFFVTPLTKGLRIALSAVLSALILSSNVFANETSAPQRSLFIEAIVAEVSQEDETSLGINWSSNESLSQTDKDQVTNTNSVIGSIGSGDLEAVQRTLHAATDSKLIVSPVVYTLDGEEATVFIGEEVPVENDQLMGVCKKSSSEVGTSLTINPVIENDSKIMLDVALEVSSLVSGGLYEQQESRKDCSPVVTENIQTRVPGNDGEVIVLSRQINDSDVSSDKSNLRLMLFLKLSIADVVSEAGYKKCSSKLAKHTPL